MPEQQTVVSQQAQDQQNATPTTESPTLLKSSLLGLVSLTSCLKESAKARGGITKNAAEWTEYLAAPVLPTVQYYLDIPDSERKTLMSEAWFQQVHAVFQQTSSYTNAFYNMGLEQYLELRSQGRDFVAKQEFIQGLEAKLGEHWGQDMLAPATALYETLAKSLTEQQTKMKETKQTVGDAVSLRVAHLQELGHEWDKQVRTAFLNKVGNPAMAFYSSLVESYILLGNNASQHEFVQGIQTRLGGLWMDSLREPLEEFLTLAKSTAEGEMKTYFEALDYDQDGILTLQDFWLSAADRVGQVKGYVNGYVNDTWTGLLQTSANTVDYWVPDATPKGDEKEPQEEDTKVASAPVTSLTALKSHVSKRLTQKAVQGLQHVRLLSATRVKEIIHIDLIEYSESMIDQVSTASKPQLTKAQERLTEALAALQTSVADAQRLVANSATVQEVQAVVSPRTQFLKAKLQAAIERTRVATMTGSQYILTKDLSTLPSDIATLLRKLQELAKQGPHTALAIQSIGSIITSIINLFYWDSASSDQKTADVAEDASDAKEKEQQPVDVPTQVEEQPAEVATEVDTEEEEQPIEAESASNVDADVSALD